MAWDSIENLKPKPLNAAVPDSGVRVTARALKSRKDGAAPTRYICVTLGAGLAKKLSLLNETAGVRLLFGTGGDVGKIAISVDATTGNFQAKRDKAGRYTLTINAATAVNRFSLDFPAFTVPSVEALRPENGQPPRAVFKMSPAMLVVAD
jgi:hypothetical protein